MNKLGLFIRITTTLIILITIFFIPAIAQDISAIADQNKKLLDSGSELLGDAEQIGKHIMWLDIIIYYHMLAALKYFHPAGRKLQIRALQIPFLIP